jgi:hypothetical protein
VLRTSRLRRPRPLHAALPLLLASLALAGCGSSHSSGTSADPATAVPATAVLYLGADVRPSGSEASGALAAGRALTHQQNPYLRLLGALQTPGSAQLDYSKDVAPWLGPHGGAFVAQAAQASALLPLVTHLLTGTGSAPFPYGAHAAQGAIVLDTSDAGKARSFLNAQAARAGAHAASYRGVGYMATSGGVAVGVVKGFAVLGSEEGLQRVIDTVQGGPSLAASTEYSKLIKVAPAGALAHLYAASATAARAGEAGGLLRALAGQRPVNVSVLASASTLSLYADAAGTGGAGGGLLSASGEGAQALSRLPGDSWLAVGLGQTATALTADVTQLKGLVSLLGAPAGVASASGITFGGLVEGLLTPLVALSSEAQRNPAAVTGWMGPGGIFASGSGLLELKGAIVIDSKDPAASRAAVGRLAATLHAGGSSVKSVSIPGTDAAAAVHVNGLPLVLDIANGRDSTGTTKFILALAEPSVHEALEPASTLASSQTQSTAAAALGEGIQPSLIFQVSTLVSIFEGIGLTEDPTLGPVLPLLHGASTLSGGGRSLGEGIERLKLVLGLAQP